MSDPTLVNGQMTDAVAQTGVIALGTAPANGLATEYQMGAHALALAMQNATANQRQSATLAAGTTTQAVAQIFTLAPSQSARATVETLTGHALVSELISISAALKAMRRGSPPPPGAHGGPVTTQGGGDHMTNQEALEAIRNAADRLNALLDEVEKKKAEGPDPATWQRLCEALDDLRRTTRMNEDRARPASCPPAASSVPVGATPPGVVIVGSGNIQTPAPPRIVGASA